MMRFVLQVADDCDFSGDMLANALRAAADAVDDPTQYFDDPKDESGFDRNGRVFGKNVSGLFDETDVVARWQVQVGEVSHAVAG